jgi:hypothetical protein
LLGAQWVAAGGEAVEQTPCAIVPVWVGY